MATRLRPSFRAGSLIDGILDLDSVTGVVWLAPGSGAKATGPVPTLPVAFALSGMNRGEDVGRPLGLFADCSDYQDLSFAGSLDR